MHELRENDHDLNTLLMFSDSYNDLFLIDCHSFLSFLSGILIKYNIDEDIFDILRNAVCFFSNGRTSIKVSDFSFAVIDYLCCRYSKTNLKDCLLINSLYWNEVNLVVYDASFLNLFIFNDSVKIDNFDDISNIVVQSFNSIYYYNPNNKFDFSFLLFNRKINFSNLEWKNINEKFNDSRRKKESLFEP